MSYPKTYAFLVRFPSGRVDHVVHTDLRRLLRAVRQYTSLCVATNELTPEQRKAIIARAYACMKEAQQADHELDLQARKRKREHRNALADAQQHGTSLIHRTQDGQLRNRQL